MNGVATNWRYEFASVCVHRSARYGSALALSPKRVLNDRHRKLSTHNTSPMCILQIALSLSISLLLVHRPPPFSPSPASSSPSFLVQCRKQAVSDWVSYRIMLFCAGVKLLLTLILDFSWHDCVERDCVARDEPQKGTWLNAPHCSFAVSAPVLRDRCTSKVKKRSVHF